MHVEDTDEDVNLERQGHSRAPGNKNRQWCGCAIHRNTVLSAAECLYFVLPSACSAATTPSLNAGKCPCCCEKLLTWTIFCCILHM